MGRDDWFRNKTWSPEVSAAFMQRLRRSRSAFAKAQYLRIQAGHLEEDGSPRLVTSALELLDLMMREFPEESQLAQAHLQRAHCMLKLSRDDDAIPEFRAALEAERRYPNLKTQAWLDFGWFAVEAARSDLYAEALRILDEFAPTEPLLFPVERYRFHGIRAVVFSDARQTEAAVAEAQHAMAAARTETTGLQYHPHLGLVRDTTSRTRRCIEALLGGTSSLPGGTRPPRR